VWFSFSSVERGLSGVRHHAGRDQELLGIWLSEGEGAKCGVAVFTELKHPGGEDGFSACVDRLKGLPEVIESVVPNTPVQRCIVHKVRHSLR
jgi:putative transposase